jgi:hypothetical protein
MDGVMQDLPRALPSGVRTLRCACASCGAHLEGTTSANGVSGFCTNCWSYDIVAVGPTTPVVADLPLTRPAAAPRVFGAAA